MKYHGSSATEGNILKGQAVPKDRGREEETFQAQEGDSKVQRPLYQQGREWKWPFWHFVWNEQWGNVTLFGLVVK